jgi:hypothetical protein
VTTGGLLLLLFPTVSGFYEDFARVADDEARHFGWCVQRMAELGHRYGGSSGAAARRMHDSIQACACACAWGLDHWLSLHASMRQALPLCVLALAVCVEEGQALLGEASRTSWKCQCPSVRSRTV